MRLLKPVRLAIALVVLAGFTVGFADFRGFVPAHRLAYFLAHLQFVPSLMATATGAVVLGLGFLAVLLLTLAFGRVYCSTLCPLGLMQDAVARIAKWVRPSKRPLPFTRPSNRVRHGVLVIIAAATVVGGASVALTWADPYSNFGRIVSGLFRPLLAAMNNTLVTPAEELGFHWLYRVSPAWPGPGILWAALSAFALVAGLAVWRGRIFCNTLCPVGTVLGLISRGSAFRLRIDRAGCTKCASCLRACKAQCLDLRTGTIDASRCVACFDCVGVCPEHGIGFEFAWARPRESERESETISRTAVADPGRRAILAGAILLVPAAVVRAALPAPAAGPPAAPVAPPGSGGTDLLLDRCTACQLCVSACLTGVLRPAFLDYGLSGLMKPRMDFSRAFCNYDCRNCGEACPTGAIASLALAEKKLTSIGVARFEQSRCIVDSKGTDCAACSEHCPTKAVDTVPFRDNLRLPQVNEELCIGCGACEYACPVRPQRAIRVEARAIHTRAKKAAHEEPAVLPKSGGFPF